MALIFLGPHLLKLQIDLKVPPQPEVNEGSDRTLF